MISASDRLHAVTLIDAAQAYGARFGPTCRILGLMRRTYHRWPRVDSWVAGDRRPTLTNKTLANKLSAAEDRSPIRAAALTGIGRRLPNH